MSRYRPLRRLLLAAFSWVVLPALAAGLLTPALAHGTERDRSKRGQQVERTMPADPKVSVYACTLSGDFTVRGWERNEVRVRVSSVEIELMRVDQIKSERATELRVVPKSRRSNASCLMFGDVEIDAPFGAMVRLQTTSGDITVTDLARVNATTTSGSIRLMKIREEATATVIGGDLSVHDSIGSFKLHATGGSIDARDLAPATASDSLTTTTVSGEVSLTHIQHQRVNVNSVSGEVVYAGALLPGGSYSFQNLSGEIRLLIPAKSSFRLFASVGTSVKFSSDFDLKYPENQNGNRGAPRRVTATVGSGESLIRISLLSGSLRISKQ